MATFKWFRPNLSTAFSMSDSPFIPLAMYVCIYVYMYVCVYVRLCVCKCVHVRLFVCIHASKYIHTYTLFSKNGYQNSVRT